ncbi:MAG: hypothetical protein HY300_02825 [Verrucomicrobia bacterium]|nr:hypothetical protein [Verrucomicrobiota bacterium]
MMALESIRSSLAQTGENSHRMQHAKQSDWNHAIRRLGLLLALAIPLLLAAGILPSVQFVREQIDIQVYPEHVEICGWYYYRNPWPFPMPQGLSIPFPVDEDHAPPVQVSVAQVSPEEKAIPVRYVLGRHRFDLTLASRGEVCVQVKHHQYTPRRDARYLLTTTQPWQKPLDRGLYRLFPHGVTIASSSYALKESDPTTLIFERSNFMPKEDWCFSWDQK